MFLSADAEQPTPQGRRQQRGKGRPLLGGLFLVLANSSATLLSTFKCVCCNPDHHGVTGIAVPDHAALFDGSSKSNTGWLGTNSAAS
jgi:hypothetical protein